MIKFSVLYPYKKGAWFDSKYYSKHHIAPYRNDPLVKGIIVEFRGLFPGFPKSAPIHVHRSFLLRFHGGPVSEQVAGAGGQPDKGQC